MKNIKIFISALVVTLFSSCQDAIDIVQPGELPTAKTFTSIEDLKKGVLGVYPQMSIMSEISFNSIFPDEVKLGFANGGQGLNDGTYGFILNSNSRDASAIWYGNYGCISAANRVLEGAEKLKVGASDSDVLLINDIEAQLRIMRAFSHFRLVSYFSENIADDNALGVMKLDHVASQTEYLPRVSNGEIFAFINEDLDTAFKDLSTNIVNSDNTLLSLDFITALRARMAAYRNNYADAGKFADQLINGDPVTGVNSYALTTQNAYSGIWTDVKQKDEVIFKLAHIKGESRIGSIWASVDATVHGSPFYTMSTDLYNLLHVVAGDIRYNSFVGGDSDPNYNSGGKGKVVIIKYSGKGTGDNKLALLNDEKIFRVSEMYLIKAESQAGLGDYAGAQATLQAINDVRFGADPDLGITAPAIPALTSSTVWAEILKQRRIELCYEGHRYLDFKRLGVKAGVNLTRNANDCVVNGACFLANTSPLFTMPIPNAELAANKKMKQNPGY